MTGRIISGNSPGTKKNKTTYDLKGGYFVALF